MDYCRNNYSEITVRDLDFGMYAIIETFYNAYLMPEFDVDELDEYNRMDKQKRKMTFDYKTQRAFRGIILHTDPKNELAIYSHSNMEKFDNFLVANKTTDIARTYCFLEMFKQSSLIEKASYITDHAVFKLTTKHGVPVLTITLKKTGETLEIERTYVPVILRMIRTVERETMTNEQISG